MSETEQRARRIVTWILLGFAAIVIGAGFFVYGTVLVGKEQAARQQKAEGLSALAVRRSVTAAKKTTAISQEEQRLRAFAIRNRDLAIKNRELAIKNCELLRDYEANARQTRRETAKNAMRFNVNSSQIAVAFKAIPHASELSRLFAYRAVLDEQRAHIGRQAQKELSSIQSVACTLPSLSEP